MVRAAFFLVILLLVALGAVWLADNPGTVTLTWQGWRVDVPIAIFIGAIAVLAGIVAVLYRLWVAIRKAPKSVGRAMQDRRHRKGYDALTRGLVAAAAGDATGARREAATAENLLEDPPLSLLLAAQAAQLAGDGKEAERLFRAMAERPDTEFLGLRGLITQALNDGDMERGLELARRAHQLKPDSAWVTTHLFDLQVGAGQWDDAAVTGKSGVKHGIYNAQDGDRKRAVLLHQQALVAAGRGDPVAAQKLARSSVALAPDLVPASVLLATLYADEGKDRKAAGVIEAAWAQAPHPDLPPVYFAAREAKEPLDKVKAAQKLAKLNPDATESAVMVACAALEAELWGEARKHLAPLAENNPSARVCRLMAELEEKEHANMAEARAWLMRATMADADPAWICQSCGTPAKSWSASCTKCHAFDGLRWQVPAWAPLLEGPGARPAAALAAPTQAPAGEGAAPVLEGETAAEGDRANAGANSGANSGADAGGDSREAADASLVAAARQGH